MEMKSDATMIQFYLCSRSGAKCQVGVNSKLPSPSFEMASIADEYAAFRSQLEAELVKVERLVRLQFEKTSGIDEALHYLYILGSRC